MLQEHFQEFLLKGKFLAGFIKHINLASSKKNELYTFPSGVLKGSLLGFEAS